MIRRVLGLGLLFTLGALSAAAGGCDRRGSIDVPEAGGYDAGPGNDMGQSFSDTGIGFSELSILRVVPDHGPFTGGNVAILRGAGFTADAQVRFGTHDVQGADHTLIDARRLQVVVPAGDVGTVDVSITVGANTFTLPHGYTYDAISVDPTRGSVAGGTFVNIVGSGTTFATGDSVLFGRTPCAGVTVVSPTRITCRTPPMSAGTVDVTVVRGTDMSETTATQAYTYYETSDPFAGGLGGGPANGTINVTAINAMTGDPVPGAFAIVGEDPATIYQGLTDSMGQISFSGPDLVGQHTVHIFKHCFERTSFVAFDAQDATAFLVPWMDPSCGMGMPPGGGRGRNGAFVAGHLQFQSGEDFGTHPWQEVPMPRDGWVRVAYVYTTQSDVDQPNPDPSLGGGIQRVLESDGGDGIGYPYRIFVRPAGLAVYALAGLENTMTGEFVPYVMGVARNVLAGPGETVTDVNIHMDIPLDHTLVASIGALPPQVRSEPDRFYLRAYMDLGGEGVIVRNVNANDFDSIRRRDATHEFRFVPEPALQGSLADGRFRIIAGWTSAFDGPPYTYVIENGVTAVDDTVMLPPFLALPDATSPATGAPIPADRMLRWTEASGAPTPDLHLILMIGGDGNPAWRMFVPGDQHEAPIPDLSSIPMVEDISRGSITWVVYALSIPGFDFDTLTYTYLNQRYWSAYAYNYFTATL